MVYRPAGYHFTCFGTIALGSGPRRERVFPCPLPGFGAGVVRVVMSSAVNAVMSTMSSDAAVGNDVALPCTCVKDDVEAESERALFEPSLWMQRLAGRDFCASYCALTGFSYAPTRYPHRRVHVGALLRQRNVRAVLDVGCGEGSLLNFLVGECAVERLVGVDLLEGRTIRCWS